MTFVIATGNPRKLEEIRRILAPLGIDAISQKEAGVFLEPEENGTTFEENALIKAKAVSEATGLPAIADDSGLCVNALDGRPGLYSARYAGENATDAEKIAKLLSEMDGVTDRNAKFVSAICCFFSADDTFCVRGECFGEIALSPSGEGGFGYDPVFTVDGLNKTFASLTGEEKDRVSHRGNSLRALRDALEKRFNA